MNHKQRNGMKGTINLSNSRAGPGVLKNRILWRNGFNTSQKCMALLNFFAKFDDFSK